MRLAQTRSRPEHAIHLRMLMEDAVMLTKPSLLSSNSFATRGLRRHWLAVPR